jgi:hypothetical protein
MPGLVPLALTPHRSISAHALRSPWRSRFPATSQPDWCDTLTTPASGRDSITPHRTPLLHHPTRAPPAIAAATRGGSISRVGLDCD